MPFLRQLGLSALALASTVLAQEPNPQLPQDYPIGGYVPTTAFTVIGFVLFAISTILLWTNWFRTGRKRYLLVLTIGMTCMTAGFVFRFPFEASPNSEGLYIIMYMFLLLSPCAFLATDYVLLGHLARSLGPAIAEGALFIRSTRIAKIFIWSDVFTFLLQAAGGGLTASGNISSASTGKTIALVGLILQLISFLLFTALLINFGISIRKNFPDSWYITPKGSIREIGVLRRDPVADWKSLYFVMLLSCIGILVRSAFRIAEFSQGYTGYLPTHEGYVNLLDYFPLYLAMTQYVFVWPTRYIHEENIGETELTPKNATPETSHV